MQKFVISELHALQGYVNYLLRKGLVPLVGWDEALIWQKELIHPSKLPAVFI